MVAKQREGGRFWRIIACDAEKKANFAANFLKNKVMIRQCFIIFGCLAIGELIVWLTGISIPSSIIGMLLLAALLQMKLIRLDWVKGISEFLIGNLGFFFVPPGVALMLYFDIIQAELLPIVVATVISTILVLVATGWTHQLLKNKADNKKKNYGTAEQ